MTVKYQIEKQWYEDSEGRYTKFEPTAKLYDTLEDAGMPEDYSLDKALSDLMCSAETERYYSWLEIEMDSICLEEDENE